MPAFLAPLAISGISALAGLFGNRKKTQEQKSTSTENFNTSNTPTYDSKTQMMRDMLMNQFLNRSQNNADYFSGYTNNGLDNINRGSDASTMNIENILSNRGLGRTSAGGSSLISNQLNRINQGSSFLNTIPQLADARERTNLTDAANYFSMIPKGTNSIGTSTKNTTGTATDPGNPLGGAFGALSNSLMGLYGEGAFAKKRNPFQVPMPG